MKSLAIVMHVQPETAAVLINDRADVARRGAVLARLWRDGSCHDWRPPTPTKGRNGLSAIAVVCLFTNPEAAALLAAAPDELRPMLRALSPLYWQFVEAIDPGSRPVVSVQGVSLEAVERSETSYAMAETHARLDTGLLGAATPHLPLAPSVRAGCGAN